MKFAHVRGKISDAELADMIEDMKELPAQVEMLLNNKKNIQKFAEPLSGCKGYLLYRSWNRLCDRNGRFFEDERDFLCTF